MALVGGCYDLHPALEPGLLVPAGLHILDGRWIELPFVC
jgi:hypothetical protein